MKALIIDGEELYRLSLKEVVSAAAPFTDVVEADSNTTFLAKTAKHTKFDLIVIHPASLGGDGADCLKVAHRLYPSTAILAVADVKGTQIPEGATSSVHRSASVVDIIRHVRQILRMPVDSLGRMSNTPATPDIHSAIKDEFTDFQTNMMKQDAHNSANIDLKRLSFRQRQILAMAADGLPNKEIAAQLTIAEGTVKAHMHAIFKVLGVSNRTQAVIRYGASGQNVRPAPVTEGPHSTDRTPAGTRMDSHRGWHDMGL
ncbi:DNA-binding response regulator [Kordiimonas sediminis]|uniref:DNA-binding response regulator n=1 Tax=Kordiimonas sediminis TaxID=1735581 RepID=A0A919APW9_9PROT|nr:response regulator transcription factor [Kordiimonas sediminis]GHF18674.1 DNA-binding response regulator [Kordiimonas sediminis]